MLTFKEYHDFTKTTDKGPYIGWSETDAGSELPVDISWVEPALKLAGEAGEVAEKFGKILRDKDGFISDEDKLQIQKELGDVLWYISTLARRLGVTLDDVAQLNMAKLQDRARRGVLKGDGDDR